MGDLYLMYRSEAGTMNIHSRVRQVGARAYGEPCSPVICCPQSFTTTSKQKDNAGSLKGKPQTTAEEVLFVIRSQAYSRTVFADGTECGHAL